MFSLMVDLSSGLRRILYVGIFSLQILCVLGVFGFFHLVFSSFWDEGGRLDLLSSCAYRPSRKKESRKTSPERGQRPDR